MFETIVASAFNSNVEWVGFAIGLGFSLTVFFFLRQIFNPYVLKLDQWVQRKLDRWEKRG